MPRGTASSLAGLLLVVATAAAQQPAPVALPGAANSLPGIVPAPSRTAAPLQKEQEPKKEPEPNGQEPPGKEPPDLLQRVRLPERDKIFMMYNDAQLEKAILDWVRTDLERRPQPGVKPDPGQFPPLEPVVLPGTAYIAKTINYPPREAILEPGFVVHRRLHFEERNAERYGWDLGIIQPFVSAAAFYKDMFIWPNSLATGAVVGFWDTSAGKCLPGSPVPYYFYPPGLTITGTAAEAAVVTGVAFIIP